MHLLTAGDSWTFGSEIKDDGLPHTVSDWDPENNAFRIPKIWPTLLSQRLNCKDHTNISYPASSNDRIVRHTISWITCLLYTSPSPRDISTSRMPSSA